jgi:hypothetical protein
LTQIATNCPNLRVLTVRNVAVISVLLAFPKLESLTCYAIDKFPTNFVHPYLKHLCVWLATCSISNVNTIIAIAKRCVNLDSLKFNTTLGRESVENLLRSVLQLKALSFYSIRLEAIEELRTLEYLRCEVFEKSLADTQMIKTMLTDQFHIEDDEVFTAERRRSIGKFSFLSQECQYGKILKAKPSS